MTINPKFQALIPPLSPEELAQLEANILRDGCRDPLVVWGAVLLDGHNRLEICQRLGIEFKTVEMEFADEEAAMDWMDANQLGRRNLSPDVARILRGRRYNRTKKAAHGRPGNLGGAKLESQSDTPAIDTAATLAKAHGVSRATIIRDGKLATVFEAMEKERPEVARAIMGKAAKLSQVLRADKKAELQKAAKLPDAKYRIVYADPPWSYNDKCDGGAVQAGGCEKHYPSMTIPELCQMPIHSICENDAVLFLWVTSPLLLECLPIISAWGFTYKASFVWDKVKHNMGHYNSVRHEFLLICTRGSCTPDVNKLHDSVQSIERTTHSTKPERFREIIEEIYPYGKRLELFARKQTDGWEAYGNQA